MSWIIIKSAGDKYSFTVENVPGNVGHTYQYAQELAEKVTAAMKDAQQSVKHGIDCRCVQCRADKVIHK